MNQLHWTRAQHLHEAVRQHELANHVGHDNELLSLGHVMSAVYHATMANNQDLLMLSEKARKITDE